MMEPWSRQISRNIVTLAAICVGVRLLGQQPVTSAGDHNQTVGTNNGLIVQENIQVNPTVERELKSAAKANGLREQGWLSILIPGEKPTPESSCIGALRQFAPKAAKSPLVVNLGDTTAICSVSKCNVVTAADGSSELPLLSVERHTTSLSVTAQIYDKQGDVLAVIENNRPHINKNKLFAWARPSSHQLNLVDNHNDTVLLLDFLNPRTLLVEGSFFGKNHSGVRISSQKVTFFSQGTAPPGSLPPQSLLNSCLTVTVEKGSAIEFDDTAP